MTIPAATMQRFRRNNQPQRQVQPRSTIDAVVDDVIRQAAGKAVRLATANASIIGNNGGKSSIELSSSKVDDSTTLDADDEDEGIIDELTPMLPTMDLERDDHSLANVLPSSVHRVPLSNDCSCDDDDGAEEEGDEQRLLLGSTNDGDIDLLLMNELDNQQKSLIGPHRSLSPFSH